MIATYESVQGDARGPGVEEWRRVDRVRSALTEFYRSLSEDERYAPEYKTQAAWERYEQTKAQVEKLAPEARRKMLRSAESLERMSIPRPADESLNTKDTDKLLLTAHERTRLEGLISRRQEKAEKGPFKANPTDILKAEYERGLAEGGPSGGATVRAVVVLARDRGLDINSVVDAQRKAHHRDALEDAQAARMRAGMVARSVPEPPPSLKKGTQGGAPRRAVGTYTGATRTFVPREKQDKQAIFKKRRPLWK